MKCKQVIARFAKFDILESVTWYNSKRKDLGKDFTAEIRKIVNYITTFPLAFPIRYNEIRIAVVDNFPYSVHYYYDKPNNTIFVSCVFNHANNPEIPISRNPL